MSNVIESWLEEYSKESVKKLYRSLFKRFLEWAKLDVNALMEEWKTTTDKKAYRKKYGILIVKYYNYLIEQGKSINTARGYTIPIRAFFNSQTDKLIISKGKIGKSQMAYGEHEFKHSQLQQMFRVANIREKAILSLGVALGFGARAFISLKRDFLEKVIAQAEHEEYPLGFWYRRMKTSQPIRSHITREACEALTDYWKTLPEKTEYAFPNGNGSHISDDGLNYTLKALTEKARITTTGQIRFHLLRKFLYSALTNTMNETNAKLCIGKSIPSDVLTYLKNKTETLKKQYGEAEKDFVLGGYTNHQLSAMDKMQEKIDRQDKTLQDFLTTFTAYLKDEITKKQAIETVTTLSNQYGRILTPKEAMEERFGEALTEEHFKQLEYLEKQRGKPFTYEEYKRLKAKLK